MKLFKNPFYHGPHLVWKQKGDGFVRCVILEAMKMWRPYNRTSEFNPAKEGKMWKKVKSIIVLISFVLPSIFAYPTILYAGKFINKGLPTWLEMDLQLRHRYEYKADFDFNDAVDDDKGLQLWRTRLNLTLKPADNFKLFYQFQDARISHDSTIGSKVSFEDWAETRQLWVEGKSNEISAGILGLSKIGVRLGRQEFSYGAERLIGGFNWSNVAQTFDAGKVMLEFDKAHLNLDIFGGGQTPNKSPREKNDFYDGSANDRVGGYYAAYTGLKDVVIEQYVINRNTDGKTVSFGQTGDGEVDDYTIGARLKGKIPETSFDYEIEAAKQAGNSGALNADAQMAYIILGYTFDHPWKPRFSFEFDYASGDSDSKDNKRETFDNLYPTNHLFYGYMDFVSLQNINNYHIQLKAKPHEKLNMQVGWHFIYLDTANDNLYAAGRTIKRTTAAGADTHVGDEVDLLAQYKFCDYADILIGYSHLFTGDFLKDTGPSDDADFFYVQTSLNF